MRAAVPIAILPLVKSQAGRVIGRVRN